MSTLLERVRTALAPQYQVERMLGAGGMGVVFLARDTRLDRLVAIPADARMLAARVCALWEDADPEYQPLRRQARSLAGGRCG